MIGNVRDVLVVLSTAFSLFLTGAGLAAAQSNPMAEPFLQVLESTLADPAQKDALCAYHAASEAQSEVLSTPVAPGTARNPVLREMQEEKAQQEYHGDLGAAQGGQRLAADAVSPEFAMAVQSLPLADPISYIEWSFKLQKLCNPDG